MNEWRRKGGFILKARYGTRFNVAAACDVLNESGEPADRWDRGVAWSFLRMFLQFVVTTIRDPGALTSGALLLRRLMAEAKVVGPQFFTAGHILNNSDFNRINLIRSV